MPERWFVPVPGVDPARVRLEHVHAAFSRWFDRSGSEHAANDKPYSVSPMTRDRRGTPGVEITTLTGHASALLRATATAGRSERLGNQVRAIGVPRRAHAHTWSELAAHRSDRLWELEFVTPTTWRSGDRSTPLPRVDTVLGALARVWACWADVPMPGSPQASGTDLHLVDLGEPPAVPTGWASVWVSDVDLRSTTVQLNVRDRHGGRQQITLSGALGTLTLRCDDPAVAAVAGPLLRLAAYCGVGAMTGRGLGVTRVRARGGIAVPRDAPHPDRHPELLDGVAG